MDAQDIIELIEYFRTLQDNEMKFEIEEFQRILKESDIDYRKEYEIPNEAKVISFTGRLIPEKGIKQLVSAVPL